MAAMLPRAHVHLRYPEFDSVHADGRNPLSGISLPAHAHTYVCGPVDFMRAIRTQLITAGLPRIPCISRPSHPGRGSDSNKNLNRRARLRRECVSTQPVRTLMESAGRHCAGAW